jgi:hypothetical protein
MTVYTYLLRSRVAVSTAPGSQDRLTKVMSSLTRRRARPRSCWNIT